VWTVTIATAGYYFGRAVESVLGKAAHYEKWAILGIVVVAVGIWLWRHLKGRREPADS
jgi:membrane protein DedA with SNARE-associated domain